VLQKNSANPEALSCNAGIQCAAVIRMKKFL
jgi:hypothetical protein